MKQLVLWVGLLVLTSFSYAGAGEASAVGSLSTKQYIVEIWRSNQNSLYVVKGKNGSVLTGKITAMELASTFPDLGKLVEEGVADHAVLNPKIARPPGLIEKF